MDGDDRRSAERRKPTIAVRHLASFSQGLQRDLDINDPYQGQPPLDEFGINNTDMNSEIPHYSSPPPSGAVREQSMMQEDSEEDFLDEDSEVTDYARGPSAMNLDSELPYKENTELLDDIDNKWSVVINYWKQRHGRVDIVKEDVTKSRPLMLNPKEIRKIWAEVEKTREVQMKEWTVRKELHFIGKHFRQRRCKKFTKKQSNFKERLDRCLLKHGIVIKADKEFCACGLEKEWHSRDVLAGSGREVTSWSQQTHTERVMAWNFGNVDMPGNYSYLDLPEGTRKYIRMDDISTQAKHIWELLTEHWGLRKPNMVISITGGDVNPLFEDTFLHKKFRDGIMKTAVSTKSWIITEGLHVGSSKEIGDIFQEDLKKSEYSELEDHANIPLLAIGPWGVVAGQESLSSIHVGSKEAKYNFIALEGNVAIEHNTLDPYHTVYLLGDDGTYGRYTREPRIRKELEKYIKQKTTIKILGSKGVPTSVVILVLGGDTFTLQKVSEAIADDVQIAVVIVNGSGPIANMLASIFKLLELVFPCKNKKSPSEWSEKEEDALQKEILKYKDAGLLTKSSAEDENNLRNFMKGRHLTRVFGSQQSDEINLDKAILGAVFGGVTEISAQLNLTLAMDRVGIAKETIFIETRKDELRTEGLVENALFVALETGKADFTQLLLDQDFGGEFNFPKFLTVKRLHSLHVENLNTTKPIAKMLRSLTKKDVYGKEELQDSNILPQIGRIVYMLMGDNYRLLYQENQYRDVCDKQLPWNLSIHEREEAIWHIFIWAVLANHKDIAELFLFESDCKIGAGLVAFKMYTELSKVAQIWHETELAEDLMENAMYFQNLAMETLDNLYEMNRDEAYANLVSVIPFHWGRYATPLCIADDSEAKRFIGHACCQTFLNLVWMKYMDLDTARWKLIPLFSLVPFVNIPLIVFDKKNLAFGSYKQEDTGVGKKEVIVGENTINEEGRERAISGGENMDTGDADSVCSITEEQNKKATIRKQNFMKRISFAWFCVKNYYTSPVMKFLHSFVTYIVFLGIFTHFVLTELRPLGDGGLSEVTIFEWLTYLWVGSIACQELAQLISRKSSGPLYNLEWMHLEPDWNHTWYWHERVKFVLQIQKVALFLSDRWNKIDALMIGMFLTSVILRFSLLRVDFDIARAFFCMTLILYYVRLLRLGYIIRSLGPRIITIREMIGDLFQFLLILSIFIISFGVAFQAMLDPNKQPSWDLLVDILWRSYWQMYGELIVDDLEGMGRTVANRNCTSDRDLAIQFPDEYQYCYTWMAFILLAVYMLITNILLLNLLIAIFSNSFEKIETNSQLVWRYHMYDLVHEYYQQVWLPPPLNVVCHLVNLFFWLTRWPRRLLFIASMRRNRSKVHAELEYDKEYESKDEKSKEYTLRNETEQAVQKECCSIFYYDNKAKEEQVIDHFLINPCMVQLYFGRHCFVITHSHWKRTWIWLKTAAADAKKWKNCKECNKLTYSHCIHNHYIKSCYNKPGQEEYMRDEDLEEMAYKRFMRNQKKSKNKEGKIKDMLKLQSIRLQAITLDLSQVKHQTTTEQQIAAEPQKQVKPSSDKTDSNSVLKKEVHRLHTKVDNLSSQLQELHELHTKVDNLTKNIGPILQYVQKKATHQGKKKSSVSTDDIQELDNV